MQYSTLRRTASMSCVTDTLPLPVSMIKNLLVHRPNGPPVHRAKGFASQKVQIEEVQIRDF